MTPQRIQRVKGQRMPAGAVYVGPGTKWANPWKPGSSVVIGGGDRRQVFRSIPASIAVNLYRLWVTHIDIDDRPFITDRLRWDHLRGMDLACWCPLDEPCHADVLLELANPGVRRDR